MVRQETAERVNSNLPQQGDPAPRAGYTTSPNESTSKIADRMFPGVVYPEHWCFVGDGRTGSATLSNIFSHVLSGCTAPRRCKAP